MPASGQGCPLALQPLEDSPVLERNRGAPTQAITCESNQSAPLMKNQPMSYPLYLLTTIGAVVMLGCTAVLVLAGTVSSRIDRPIT